MHSVGTIERCIRGNASSQRRPRNQPRASIEVHQMVEPIVTLTRKRAKLIRERPARKHAKGRIYGTMREAKIIQMP